MKHLIHILFSFTLAIATLYNQNALAMHVSMISCQCTCADALLCLRCCCECTNCAATATLNTLDKVEHYQPVLATLNTKQKDALITLLNLCIDPNFTCNPEHVITLEQLGLIRSENGSINLDPATKAAIISIIKNNTILEARLFNNPLTEETKIVIKDFSNSSQAAYSAFLLHLQKQHPEALQTFINFCLNQSINIPEEYVTILEELKLISKKYSFFYCQNYYQLNITTSQKNVLLSLIEDYHEIQPNWYYSCSQKPAYIDSIVIKNLGV